MSKMGQELERKLDENKYEMWEALKRVGDSDMWGMENGDLVWMGESADGNLIETKHPLDIIGEVLAKIKEATK